MKNKFIQTIKAPQLHKRIKHGYVILDIEPSSDNQSIFWLHMTEFNADGTVVTSKDIVNINASQYNPAKQNHMLQELNKPFNDLKSSKLAMRRQARDFFNRARRRLPIFIYGQALDPRLLATLLRNQMVELIDLQSVYGQSTNQNTPALATVAEIMTGGVVTREHVDTHSPIEDVRLTNIVLQGLVHTNTINYRTK